MQKVKVKEEFGTCDFTKRFVGKTGTQVKESEKGAKGKSGKTVAVDFTSPSGRLYIPPEHLEQL